jgi:hypothetical protein
MAAVERRLQLHLLHEPEEVRAEDLEPMVSPHSGRRLRRVEIRFKTQEEDSKEVNRRLLRARDRDGALVDASGTQWLVTSNSYSFQNGGEVHSHHAELQELEELRVERLEFLGLSVTPTVFEEEYDDVIVISAIVEPDAELDAALEREITTSQQNEELRYFDVVRVGISDEPLRMRFGRCLWSDQTGNRTHLIRFVEASWDEEPERSGISRWFQPELRWAMRKSAEAEEAVAALLETLRSAGALSDDNVADIETRIAAAWEKRYREFDKAKDLRELL